MKKKSLLLAALICIVGSAFGQNYKSKGAQKFDKRLLCPFENGMGREPKEPFSWDLPDKKVIMISKVDTAIRSCIEGKVASINPTEDGHYEIVTFYKDYYFWYYGVIKPLVNINQVVKAGQELGTYKHGQEMEFRMFKDEVPIDSREYLDCKVTEEKKDNKP